MGWSAPCHHSDAVPRGRRHQLVAEAELAQQLDRPGHPGQERVGAGVDGGQAGERRREDLAAEAVGRLEDGDRAAGRPPGAARRRRPGR